MERTATKRGTKKGESSTIKMPPAPIGGDGGAITEDITATARAGTETTGSEIINK